MTLLSADVRLNHRRRPDLIEEAEHLAGTDSAESIAHRLGYSKAEHLYTVLGRYGRRDLADKIRRERP